MLYVQETQKGLIGITLVANWFLPLTDSKSDQKAAERAIDFMYGWKEHLSPSLYYL
jgi:beta-glucosidase